MEKWEYLSEIVVANIDDEGVREFLRNRWPNWKPGNHSPQTMMPILNNRGQQGWELVHMEPVPIGGDADVEFHAQTVT